MNKETWAFLKFFLKLNLKHIPRVLVSPYVGAVRGVWEAKERMDAELDAFIAKRSQRADRNPTRSFNA